MWFHNAKSGTDVNMWFSVEPAEDEMVGWYHQLIQYEAEQTQEAWHAAVHGVAKSQT